MKGLRKLFVVSADLCKVRRIKTNKVSSVKYLVLMVISNQNYKSSVQQIATSEHERKNVQGRDCRLGRDMQGDKKTQDESLMKQKLSFCVQTQQSRSAARYVNGDGVQ